MFSSFLMSKCMDIYKSKWIDINIYDQYIGQAFICYSFFSSKVMDRKAMSVGIKKRLITSPTIFYSSSRSRIWAIQRPGEMNTRGTDKSSSYFIHSRTDVQSHDPFIDFFPPAQIKKERYEITYQIGS